jgi:hypothetical protein
MHQPTPFAQLGYTQKTASDLFSTGNAAADLGVELLAGSNPFSGVPFYGARAVDDFAKGNVMSGLGNLAWGGLSFVPGAILGKGAVKGLAAGAVKKPGMIAKGLNAVKTPIVSAVNTAAKGTGVAGTVARGAQTYGQAMQKGQQIATQTLSPVIADAGSRLVGKTIPMTGGKKLSQQAARNVAGWGGYNTAAAGIGVAAPNATAAPAAAAAVTQTAPQYAPSWYTAVTGQTDMPQYR